MKKTLLMLLVGICACAGAKTVALWPLNMDAERGSQSGRSLVSYHTLAATATSTGIGTRPNGVGIPANVEVPEGLDAADFADDGRTWAIGDGLLDCPTLNPVLEMTNSWTIEGWFHLKSLPANGNWIPLFHTRSNAMGWLFTIRQRSEGNFDYELFAETCVADGTRFLDPVDPVTVTNGFHHYALTYDHDATGVPGKGVWTFYIDGEKQGVSITNTVAVSQRINTTSLEIMGRRNVRRTRPTRACSPARSYLAAASTATPSMDCSTRGVFPPACSRPRTSSTWMFPRARSSSSAEINFVVGLG